MRQSITILNSYGDVEPYIETASAGADTERDALGFLPPNAFRQSAVQGKLFIAVDADASFLGHLMSGGVYPYGKVIQLYCDPKFRNRGVARALINELIRYSHARSFLSLSAKVASDLSVANDFYERMGFITTATFPGGKARNRVINRRVRDLHTPSLFDYIADDHKALPSFGGFAKFGTKTPIYAIDLNVLFDVSKQRPRRKEAGSVFRAGFSNEIRIVIAREFVDELNRNAEKFPDDPHLELALELPILEAPKPAESAGLERDLAGIVFPERSAQGTLSEQDKSDLRHMATAIHHKIAGFITSEKSMLRMHDRLKTEFNLEVLGVSDFADADSDHENEYGIGRFFQTSETELAIAPQEDSASVDVHAFLTRLDVPPAIIYETTSKGDSISPRRHIIFRGDGGIVSFASWTLINNPQRTVRMFLCADEGAPGAKVAIDHTFGKVCKSASSNAPALICLDIRSGHPVTKNIALAYGFRATPEQESSGTSLQKIAFGNVIDEQSWESTGRLLKSLFDLAIPTPIPKFESPDQSIQINGPAGKKSISLQDMESLLSPTLILFPGRHGVIVPIKRVYADELLGTAENLSLLSAPEAILLKDRVYYCSPRARHVLIPGTPILFYESSPGHGRKSIVAAGRVTVANILTGDMIDAETRRKGVLKSESLEKIVKSKNKLVVTFDNIMAFDKLVSLKELKQIGYSDPTNFVTARRIESHHLLKTINEGLQND